MKYLLFLFLPVFLFGQVRIVTQMGIKKSMIRGDATTLSWRVKTDMTSDSLLFIAVDSDNDAALRMTTGGGGITSAYSSPFTTITATISAATTENFIAGTYQYDITNVTDSVTLIMGTLDIQADYSNIEDTVIAAVPYYRINLSPPDYDTTWVMGLLADSTWNEINTSTLRTIVSATSATFDSTYIYQNTDSLFTKTSHIVNLDEFNPNADGVTDDSSAFMNALDALPDSGGTLIVNSGTYKISGTVRDTVKKSLHIIGVGKPKIILDGGAYLSFEGEYIGATTLSQSLSRGDDTVYVADASSYQTGDIFYLSSDDIGETSWNYLKNDVMLIKSAPNDTTIILANTLNFAYDKDTSGVSIEVWRSGQLIFENFQIEIAHANSRFDLLGLKNAKLKNLDLYETGQTSNKTSIFSQQCVNIYFDNIHARYTQYAVQVARCRNVSIINSSLEFGNALIVPSNFCDGVFGFNLYGYKNVATFDSHQCFNVHYEKVRDLSSTSAPNCRAWGVTLKDVYVHSTHNAQQFIITLNTLVDTSTMYEYDVIMDNVELDFPNANSIYDGTIGLTIGNKMYLNKVKIGGVEGGLYTRGLYISNSVLGYAIIRTRSVFINTVFDSSLANQRGLDYALYLSNGLETSFYGCTFAGYDSLVALDTDQNRIRSFDGCFFDNITYFGKSTFTGTNYNYHFTDCTFEVDSFASGIHSSSKLQVTNCYFPSGDVIANAATLYLTADSLTALKHNIIPASANTYNLGSTSYYFNNLYNRYWFTNSGGYIRTNSAGSVYFFDLGNVSFRDGDAANGGTVNFTGTIASNLIPTITQTKNLGSSSNYWHIGYLDSLYLSDTWSVYYTNGSGLLIPLGLGASGTVLKSNGATSAPTWQTDATGAGGSAYADSVVINGRHVPGDSLMVIDDITSLIGDSLAANNWSFILPSDTVSFRAYSDAKYQTADLDSANVSSLIGDSLAANNWSFLTSIPDSIIYPFELKDSLGNYVSKTALADSAFALTSELSSYLLISTLNDSNFVLTSDINSFTKLQGLVSDKTLVNEEGDFTIDGNWVNIANPWAANEIVSTVLHEGELNSEAELETLTGISIATETEARIIAWQSKDSSLVEVTQNGVVMAGNIASGWYELTMSALGDSLSVSSFDTTYIYQYVDSIGDSNFVRSDEMDIPANLLQDSINTLVEYQDSSSSVGWYRRAYIDAALALKLESIPDSIIYPFELHDSLGNYIAWTDSASTFYSRSYLDAALALKLESIPDSIIYPFELKDSLDNYINWTDSATAFYGRAYIDALAATKINVSDSATWFYGRSELDALLATKQASGTYLIPTDSTAIRNYSEALYQDKDSDLDNPDVALAQLDETYIAIANIDDAPADDADVPVSSKYIYDSVGNVADSNYIHSAEANSIDSDMYVDDSIDDAHINWGSGAGQVNADDIGDGSTNAIITLTQETNFQTGYDHSQDNTQAHSDYMLNTGDAATGTYDFGGADDLEIPNADNPTTDAEGQIAFDNNNNMIEVYDGTASRVLPLLQSRTWTFIQPDSVQSYVDTLILMQCITEAFPFGVTVVDIAIQSDIDYVSEVFTFVELDTYPSASPSVIEAVTSDTYYEEDDGTLSDASVAADAFIGLVLDGTPEDAEMVAITMTYYINEGN